MDTIEHFADLNYRRTTDFRTNYPEFSELIEIVLGIEWRLIVAFIQQGEPDKSALWIGQMLQTLHGYFKSSAFLIINRSLDEGVAILRMAAELSRDVRCIYNNRALVDVWLNKGTSTDAEKAYRKHFSFDVNTSEGKMGHAAYKLTSKIGIHGHITTMTLSKTHAPLNDDEFLQLAVDDTAVLKLLCIWLKSFVSIHRLAFDIRMLVPSPEHEELCRYRAECLQMANVFSNSH